MTDRPDPARLILFTRYPRPGFTKTRLIPFLGAQGAAELQESMTRHMLGWAMDLVRRTGIDLQVHFDGGSVEGMQRLFGSQVRYVPQGTGDLGQRLEAACAQSFAEGMCRVLVVGADCPALTSDRMCRALEALESHDLVITPATDGGYVLIGLSRPEPGIFRGVDWGTERVFRQTLAIASQLGLTVWSDQALPDVDHPTDLAVWDRCRAELAPPRFSERPEVSVIIPALNEEEYLGGLLSDLKRQREISAQIIVVDGGSTDGTRRKAAEAAVTCLEHAPGRGGQMNRGAGEARAPYLLFLHADSRLSSDLQLRRAVDALQTAILQEGSDQVAGHFRLRFDGGSDSRQFFYRCLERKTALNRPGTVHGDQGLLLSADYFRRLGGFEETLPWLEDVGLAGRIESSGRWFLLPDLLMTSARRFESEGFLSRYLLMGLMIAMYQAGNQRFLLEAPGIYRRQKQTCRLDLWPFVKQLFIDMQASGPGATLQQWTSIGRLLRVNAWQGLFWLDCLLHEQSHRTPLLDIWNRLFSDRHGPSRIMDRLLGLAAWAAVTLILAPAVWLNRIQAPRQEEASPR